ncbi:MAG: M48 family metallopeptidase [Coriobacteriales bacterium]|nr:M48 family metallopeptidase [Coriobacteriales bacterium]
MLTPSVVPALPDRLTFPALGELWWLEYRDTGTRGSAQVRMRSDAASLRVSGEISERAGREALRRFVLRYARQVLPVLAQGISDECRPQLGRSARDFAVMNARRRWGSCSSDGRIRLNCKLLFFPKEQARQVILHELAHLREMNHSKRFYELLFALPGSNKDLEKANRRAMVHVPEWFLSA